MIDLDLLCEKGLLKGEEYQHLFWGADRRKVDYGILSQKRIRVLKNVIPRFVKTEEYEIFCAENAFWLESYSVFMALKEHFSGKPFFEWKKPLPPDSPTSAFTTGMQRSCAIFYPLIR